VSRASPGTRVRAGRRGARVQHWPRILWWVVLSAGLLPALWLGARTGGAFGGLGVNPIETLLTDSGTFTIIFLLLALSVTPLRRLTGQAPILRLRRMLGLLAFGYATAHFLIWLGVDLFFDWQLIIEDLTTRPFVMAGFAAWMILLLLAATSHPRRDDSAEASLDPAPPSGVSGGHPGGRAYRLADPGRLP
jgi:methionine sulfoxide reductase heme-binding subunit